VARRGVRSDTPLYISSEGSYYSLQRDSWSYSEWDDDAPDSIYIECLAGTVRIRQLELYHDSLEGNSGYSGTYDGTTCPSPLPDWDVSDLCAGAGFFFMANTIPNALQLTWPTLSDNLDAGVGSDTCGTCSNGGGDTALLLLSETDILASEPYCQYETSEAPIGCNETEPGVNRAIFYPWFVNEGAGIITIDYEHEGGSDQIGGDIVTLPGTQCPFSYGLAYTDGDNVTQGNAAVMLDHIGVSGIITWQEWDNSVFACKLTGGDAVFIELPAIGVWGFP